MCLAKVCPAKISTYMILIVHLDVHRYFPKIFGPKENEPLNKKASMDALERLTAEVSSLTYMYSFIACHVVYFSIRPCQ